MNRPSSHTIRAFLGCVLFLVAGLPAQTQILDKFFLNSGGNFGLLGSAVAFGLCANPNGPSPRRVLGVGLPVYGAGNGVLIIDESGAEMAIPAYFGVNQTACSLAFGKVAVPGNTPWDVMIHGMPDSNLVHVRDPVPGASANALLGTQAGERFGHAVAAIGDITGDGVEDFIVGAPRYDTTLPDTGRVRVYQGATFAPIREHTINQGGALLGSAVAGIGDVDADGVPDYAAGAPGYNASASLADAGRVVVWSGATGAQIGALTRSGTNAGGQLGYSVAACGDINQDGRPDFGAGAPDPAGFPGLGRIDVFSGLDGSLIVSHSGGTVSGHLGWSLAGGHDVDRDGFPDLVAGGPGNWSGKGHARLYSGRTGTILLQVGGTQNGEALGSAVALGQYNEDQYAEFAIGGPLFDWIQADTGAFSVYTGAIRWSWKWPSDPFGGAGVNSVDVAGDVNGDGFDDLIPDGDFNLYASLGQEVVTPVGACSVYLDFGTLITTLPPIPLGPAGAASVPVFIPADPILANVRFVLQGVVYPPTGGYALSNAVKLTIGYANHVY